jgi:hypothetical protein
MTLLDAKEEQPPSKTLRYSSPSRSGFSRCASWAKNALWAVS